jgi:Leucine-rich repeat (LRR) protein
METDNSATTVPAAESKPKRRWHQYSLRTLMICVTLFAVACSWFEVKMQQAKRQREAVEAFLPTRNHKAAFAVIYDYNFDKSGNYIRNAQPPGPVWLRNLLGIDFMSNVVEIEGSGNITDAQLLCLKVFPRLRSLHFLFPHITGDKFAFLQGLNQLETLDLTESKLNDAGMRQIEGLAHLKCLFLIHARITDAGLEYLKGLSRLEALYLAKNNITGAGLECLNELTNLKNLDMANTYLTDDGLKHLRGLSKLQYLDLRNTSVTDAGLVHLKGLHQLKSLRIANTIITAAGLENIKELTNLQFLDLESTRITDAGLERLKGLQALQEIRLGRTNVGGDGVRNLQKALPQLKIELYQVMEL